MEGEIPPPEELARVQGLLEAHPWTFARTMPQIPHWYSLREKWACDADFVAVVKFINRYGRMERFPPDRPNGKPFTVMIIGGFRYWLFGERCEEGPYYRGRDTLLINRKPEQA